MLLIGQAWYVSPSGGHCMGKILDIKKRRGAQRLLQEAADDPETKAIKMALEQPGIMKKVERLRDNDLEMMHKRAVEGFKNSQLAAFWDKVPAPSQRKTTPVPSSTATITEAEFLRIVGRGDKSSATNSSWILRRIRHAAAKGDSSLFPSFKQMGRERVYHLDSVKAWLAQHPLETQT